MANNPALVTPTTLWDRFWQYQAERFPLVSHGLLIAAFSGSAVALSWLLRAQTGFPAWPAFVVAFGVCLAFFLQLRIADEFKDYEEDTRFRPYRPVPRGLVTLPQLAGVFLGAALVQAVLVSWWAPALWALLLVGWGYLALMSREFFCRRWLKARPVWYLATHMLMLPLVDLFATACDWLAAGAAPPPGLSWFLVVSFCNGLVFELGRKIRAPQQEEPGVETYTALWGLRQATLVWWLAMAMAGLCAVVAAHHLAHAAWMAGIGFGLLGVSGWAGWRFVQAPSAGTNRPIEALSGVWLLMTYLNLGIVPLLLQGRLAA